MSVFSIVIIGIVLVFFVLYLIWYVRRVTKFAGEVRKGKGVKRTTLERS